MPKHLSKKQRLIACQMSFEGVSNSQIAKILGVTQATVSNWRKSEIWQEFEAELIRAYKEQVISQQDLTATPS